MSTTTFPVASINIAQQGQPESRMLLEMVRGETDYYWLDGYRLEIAGTRAPTPAEAEERLSLLYDGYAGGAIGWALHLEGEDYTRAAILAEVADGPSEESVSVVRDILLAKQQAGEDAFLWLHDSGDCILWPSEAESENDDGAHARERWQLTDEACALLRASGAVDDIN